MDYQRGIKICRDQSAYYVQLLTNVGTESKNIFNPEHIFNLRKAFIAYNDTSVNIHGNYFELFDSLARYSKFDFITTDKKTLFSYCFVLDTYSRVIISYMLMIKHQKELAGNLLIKLQEKY